MTAAQWQRVKEITADALELEPSGRAAFAAQTCASDSEVLEEVLRLLDEAELSGESFLSNPPLIIRELLTRRPPPAPRFSAGQMVAGRFQIEYFVAEGGMGEVYAALDLELHESVALKTIRSAIASSADAIERFKREVKQSRGITHPNVCRVYDLFSHEESSGEVLWFLTMELLQGQTLGAYLSSRGCLTLDQALPLIRDIVAALTA